MQSRRGRRRLGTSKRVVHTKSVKRGEIEKIAAITAKKILKQDKKHEIRTFYDTKVVISSPNPPNYTKTNSLGRFIKSENKSKIIGASHNDSHIDREGNKLFIHSIYLKCQVDAGSSANADQYLRWLIVSLDGGSTPAVQDILQTEDSVGDGSGNAVNYDNHIIESLRSMKESSNLTQPIEVLNNYKVIMDKIIHVDKNANNAPSRKVLDYHLKFNKPHEIQYNGDGIQDSVKGQLWLIVFGSEATPSTNPTLTYIAKIRYRT